MNGKSFYLEIGNIDDDLIQEASEARGHKVRKINFVRLASMAACLCLICTAMFFGMHRDVIYYNEAPAPLTSKVLVPSDENTTVLALTYQELFAYYGLEPFPDELSELQRIEQKQFFLYQSPENEIYDTNILNYRSEDGMKTLSIMIKKGEADEAVPKKDIRKSRVDGVSFVLAMSENTAQPVYWAELYHGDVTIRIISSGMDEKAFTNLIREVIQCQK